MGKGDINSGLREFRKNNEWVRKIRTRSECYSSSVVLAMIVIVVGGVASTIYHGFKLMMGQGE